MLTHWRKFIVCLLFRGLCSQLTHKRAICFIYRLTPSHSDTLRGTWSVPSHLFHWSGPAHGLPVKPFSRSETSFYTSCQISCEFFPPWRLRRLQILLLRHQCRTFRSHLFTVCIKVGENTVFIDAWREEFFSKRNTVILHFGPFFPPAFGFRELKTPANYVWHLKGENCSRSYEVKFFNALNTKYFADT